MFRNNQADVLVATEMVAKGLGKSHHSVLLFKCVTLSVVFYIIVEYLILTFIMIRTKIW